MRATGEGLRRPGSRAWGLCRVGAMVMAMGWAAGCDYPFEPYQENGEGPFSVFGYLDLKADTQWVRVMPIRHMALPGPEPIDAVVTLEQVGTGRTVTLRDSLFRFSDPALEGEAYAHNFWTTEPLEPGATYRLRAERSDGAATTADVVMPQDLEFSFQNNGPDNALLRVRAAHILAVEVLFTMSNDDFEPASALVVPQLPSIDSDNPGLHNLFVDGGERRPPPAGFLDMGRQEIRLAVAAADWPYHPDLTDLEVTLPGLMPSNVENGFGFVGGVALWTVPFHDCQIIPRPVEIQGCLIDFNARSASISGRVIREPCGEPHVLAQVHLREMFDAERGVLRTWKTGWAGEYRFEGIAPGAELTLELAPGADPIRLPPLQAGERYVVPDITVAGWC